MAVPVVPLLLLFAPPGPAEERVRVTVVVVLATDADMTVDPALVELARQVRKREPKLTGFRVHAAEAKSLRVGETATFELAERQEMAVTVNRPKDARGQITLTIKPPGLENITYGCACDKFFPVVTPYRTRTGEVLIVAVMARPCTLPAPDRAAGD